MRRSARIIDLFVLVCNPAMDPLRVGRDLVERVEQLCKELEDERGANKTLKSELEKLQDECDALKGKVEARYVIAHAIFSVPTMSIF